MVKSSTGIAESCFTHSSIVTVSVVICTEAPSFPNKNSSKGTLYLCAAGARRKIARGRRDIMVCKMASQRPNSGSNLLGKSMEELRSFAESLGEPSYRGAQIYH